MFFSFLYCAVCLMMRALLPPQERKADLSMVGLALGVPLQTKLVGTVDIQTRTR